MITKTLRKEERLEIAVNLLDERQVDEYAARCAELEHQPERNGFHNTPAECEGRECALCSLNDADKRAIDCPYVIGMKQFVFLTTEGTTFGPHILADTDEPRDVENCQMLGTAQGQDQQHAQQNLLKESSWIVEAGFNPDEIFGYELAEKA